jgi:hypothetical protein
MACLPTFNLMRDACIGADPLRFEVGLYDVLNISMTLSTCLE